MHLRLLSVASLLRLATPAATALLAVSSLAGCQVEGELDVEPMVRYEGQPRDVPADYKPGQSVVVQSRMGDAKVVVGTSEQLETTFEPFTMDSEKNEAKATDEIKNMLNTEVIQDGGLIRVKVWRDDDASGNLGADVTVRLPADFNGGFEAQMDMGDVEADFGGVEALTITKVKTNGPGDIVLHRVTGDLDAETELGDIDVQFDKWALQNGVVSTGNGDVALSLPAASNGKIQAFADGPDALVSEPSPLPETWAMEEAGANSKSFTFGDGSGGLIDITTGLGDIVIGAN